MVPFDSFIGLSVSIYTVSYIVVQHQFGKSSYSLLLVQWFLWMLLRLEGSPLEFIITSLRRIALCGLVQN